MIKFFRHLRYGLIESGKTTKYLKYAVGEIILVVIGILLALQINNFNNSLTLKQGNKAFLQKIKKELILNIERLEILTSYDVSISNSINLKQSVSNCDSILKLSYLGFKDEHIDFILNNRYISGGSRLNLYDNSYSELLNTGKLYRLGSDSLQNSIKNYYKLCEREDQYNQRNTRFAIEGFELTSLNLNKIIRDHQNAPQGFDLQNYPWYFNVESAKYQKMQYGLNKILNAERINLGKIKVLKKETDRLIAIIENELKTNYND